MESEEVSVLIWTNFDSFANSYVIRLAPFKNAFVQIELALNSLQIQKGLELVFESMVFSESFDETFSLVILDKVAKSH